MPSLLAVLFDVDGVLVDSAEAHFVSWRAAVAELGHELTREEFDRGFGRTSREILRQTLGERFDEQQAAQIDARKEEHYRRLVAEDYPLMPGAAELVADLRGAGLLLGLGSSGPPENVRLVVEHLPPPDNFGAVITGADVTRGKPDPEVFLLGAGALGVHPSRCVVIEDAVPGVEAALAAGMKVAALAAHPARRSLLQDAGAHLVVDALDELSAAALRGL